MNKHLLAFLIVICCSGCSVVSRQYYYVPNTPHQTIKKKAGYSKTISSQIQIPDASGKDIGSVTTSNGTGVPLFFGPGYVPVVPVGAIFIFSQRLRQFGMDLIVRSDDEHFMALTIDSVRYKRISDSLFAIKSMRLVDFPTTDCYMIINGSERIPLRVKEYFMGQGSSHSYQLVAPVGFGKVHTMTMVTGNPILDNRLKTVVFKRKKRITHYIFGLS